MKKVILWFLLIILAFYFLMYVLSKVLRGNPEEFLDGLMVVFWLTWILMPLFSVVLGVVCGIKNYGIPCITVTALLNAIFCGVTLFIVFNIDNISPNSTLNSHFKYCIIYIFGLTEISYFVVYGIKKIIRR